MVKQQMSQMKRGLLATSNDDKASTNDADAEDPEHDNDNIEENNKNDPQPLLEIQTNDDRIRRELN